MPSIEATVLVAQPSTELWRIVSDFGSVADWNPNLESSHLLSGPKRGVGTGRQCNLRDGKNSIQERITHWEEGRSLSLEITEGTMPLESATVEIRLEPTSHMETTVYLHMQFVPKGGWLGAVGAAVFMKPMMARMFRRLLAGLKEHAERPGVSQRAA